MQRLGDYSNVQVAVATCGAAGIATACLYRGWAARQARLTELALVPSPRSDSSDASSVGYLLPLDALPVTELQYCHRFRPRRKWGFSIMIPSGWDMVKLASDYDGACFFQMGPAQVVNAHNIQGVMPNETMTLALYFPRTVSSASDLHKGLCDDRGQSAAARGYSVAVTTPTGGAERIRGPHQFAECELEYCRTADGDAQDGGELEDSRVYSAIFEASKYHFFFLVEGDSHAFYTMVEQAQAIAASLQIMQNRASDGLLRRGRHKVYKRREAHRPLACTWIPVPGQQAESAPLELLMVPAGFDPAPEGPVILWVRAKKLGRRRPVPVGVDPERATVGGLVALAAQKLHLEPHRQCQCSTCMPVQR
eukprot:TRINITY_DN2401_c0_g1_i1.p2 TRINITY_DN2401_c0_g1~~TRINITY_DN2401_c0_g1_i1.p2  ORF type:complete len:365 (+),score=90.44 TRINITY_DN2401_c0_g1_i1:98-1192(+)